MFFFLVFFSLLLAVSVTNRVAEMDGDDSNGTAFYLSKYPLAMCLDGTAGAYTFRAGLETERFLIFHEGGGACESISDCTYVTHTRTHTRTCVHQMQSCIYIYIYIYTHIEMALLKVKLVFFQPVYCTTCFTQCIPPTYAVHD